MIIKFECDYCDNKDTSKVFYYDGCLGYEALLCKVCGAMYDHNSSEPYNEWCLQFFTPENKKTIDK